MKKMEINGFWGRTRKDAEPDKFRPGLTVQGLSINIADLLKTGNIDEAGEKNRKRMIFGDKQRMEDLTAIDTFREKLKLYKNIVRKRKEEQAEDKPPTIQTKTDNKIKEPVTPDVKTPETTK